MAKVIGGSDERGYHILLSIIFLLFLLGVGLVDFYFDFSNALPTNDKFSAKGFTVALNSAIGEGAIFTFCFVILYFIVSDIFIFGDNLKRNLCCLFIGAISFLLLLILFSIIIAYNNKFFFENVAFLRRTEFGFLLIAILSSFIIKYYQLHHNHTKQMLEYENIKLKKFQKKINQNKEKIRKLEIEILKQKSKEDN